MENGLISFKTAIVIAPAWQTFTWVGLFRLQPDFRIQIPLRKLRKNGVEMYFECDFSSLQDSDFRLVPLMCSAAVIVIVAP